MRSNVFTDCRLMDNMIKKKGKVDDVKCKCGKTIDFETLYRANSTKAEKLSLMTAGIEMVEQSNAYYSLYN